MSGIENEREEGECPLFPFNELTRADNEGMRERKREARIRQVTSEKGRKREKSEEEEREERRKVWIVNPEQPSQVELLEGGDWVVL